MSAERISRFKLAGESLVHAVRCSDEASGLQSGITVASNLRILLDRARVPGPFVLAAHSSGAAYARIFAGRFPDQVVGMVLLDGQPAEAFERLPSFPAFYSGFRQIT